MLEKPKNIYARRFVRQFWRDVLTATKIIPSSIYPLTYDKLKEYVTLGSNIIVYETPSLTSKVVETYLKGQKLIPEKDRLTDEEEMLFGYIYGCRGYGVIFVGYDDLSQRKLFTLAHEIGHYYRHYYPIFQKELYAAESLFPDDSLKAHSIYARKEIDPEKVSNQMSSHDKLMEIEANAFAAELLMPIDEIKHLISIKSIRSREDLKINIIEYFNVSNMAAEIRLSELNI